MGRKITIENIREQVKPFNWELVSDKYTNLDEELHFKCDRGHDVYDSWRHVREQFNCPVCRQLKYEYSDTTPFLKKKKDFRVLALDQATKISGYAVFDNKKLIRYGTFETNQAKTCERINSVKTWLINVINAWKPDFIFMEGIQYQVNAGVTTFQVLAQLQGVLIDTCYEYDIPCEIVAPSTWRKYCDVQGRTRIDKKRSAQLIIKDIYDKNPTQDEADAILIGHYGIEHIPKKKEEIKFEDWT